MNNLSIVSKKEILNFLTRFNEFFSKKLSSLNLKNLKQIYKDLLFDKRFVITSAIVFFSIFAHLSTPAFYQDKWVISKIKKQLENEFDITFLLPEKVDYSLFPIPSFHLKNISFVKGERELGKIEKMKINLSYKKFLNKEKINIQDIHFNNSQFNVFSEDLNDFISFIDEKINTKKLFINNSSIFLKNKNNETYSIIKINNSISFFDELTQLNEFNLDGEIYNTSFNLSFNNDVNNKIFRFNLNFKELDLAFVNELKYANEENFGFIEIVKSLKNYKTEFSFNKKYVNFKSINENDKSFIYEGNLELKPFNAFVDIEYDEIDILKFFSNDSILYEVIRSNILLNENLNYDIKLISKKIKNHKKLQDLNLRINFSQGNLNLSDSSLMFKNIANLEMIDGTYVNNLDEEFFFGNINLNIIDKKNFYSFLQTNKKYRDDIDNLNVKFKFDYKKNEFLFDEIYIDGESSDEIIREINIFNSEKKGFKNIIDLKKFSNKIFSSVKRD